jgi:hypothetical protein
MTNTIRLVRTAKKKYYKWLTCFVLCFTLIVLKREPQWENGGRWNLGLSHYIIEMQGYIKIQCINPTKRNFPSVQAALIHF